MLVPCSEAAGCHIGPTGNCAFSFPVHFITKFFDGCSWVLCVLAVDRTGRAQKTDWWTDLFGGMSWNKTPAAELGPDERVFDLRGNRGTLWCLWSCEAVATQPWTKVQNWRANYTYTSIQEGQQALLPGEPEMHK